MATFSKRIISVLILAYLIFFIYFCTKYWKKTESLRWPPNVSSPIHYQIFIPTNHTIHNEKNISKIQEPRITIITVIAHDTSLNEYRHAVDSVRCYSRIHGYNFLILDDSFYQTACPHPDKFFRRHCIVAEYLMEGKADYVLFIDTDIGVVNPKRKIEDYITSPEVQIYFYDRFYNWEITTGSYIVKNSLWSQRFLKGWADYNYRQPNSFHGSDNGAIHAYILEYVLPGYDLVNSICYQLYQKSTSWDDLFTFEACARNLLDDNQHFPTIYIFEKGTGWARDNWLSNSVWNEKRDFMIHGWKERELQKYYKDDLPIEAKVGIRDTWFNPLAQPFDMNLCSSKNFSWNYDKNLMSTEHEINDVLAKYSIEVEELRIHFAGRSEQILTDVFHVILNPPWPPLSIPPGSYEMFFPNSSNIQKGKTVNSPKAKCYDTMKSSVALYFCFTLYLYKKYSSKIRRKQHFTDFVNILKPRITILTILSHNTSILNYQHAIDSIKCYSNIHGYTFLILEDSGYEKICPHNDKFFKRHCIVANVLAEENCDYLLFIDADIGVVNPKRKIEEFITSPETQIYFYDRFFNWEVTTGSYIVKNSIWSRKFLKGWADYYYRLPDSFHGSDNGAIHAYLTEYLLPYGVFESSHCLTLYHMSSNWNDLFVFESCVRNMLGSHTNYGSIQILKKGTGWARDNWITNDIWNIERDFMIHGWKEKELKSYKNHDLPLKVKVGTKDTWLNPLTGNIHIELCNPGNTSWNYDKNLIDSDNAIEAILANYSQKVELDRIESNCLAHEMLIRKGKNFLDPIVFNLILFHIAWILIILFMFCCQHFADLNRIAANRKTAIVMKYV